MHCLHNVVVPRLGQCRVFLVGRLVLDTLEVPIIVWLVRVRRATQVYS